MVHAFATRLHPAILSLGSSRKLWEDAAVVPKDVVLFGNLPTKNFYSDAAVPIERVEEMTRDLIRRMAETRHPYIVGSECDVLLCRTLLRLSEPKWMRCCTRALLANRKPDLR